MTTNDERAPFRALHNRLWLVCRDQEDYHDGSDTDNHEKPDCSCGCKHYVRLEGKAVDDWGVCASRTSPRSGLLTFEHMGCSDWEDDDEFALAPEAALTVDLPAADRTARRQHRSD